MKRDNISDCILLRTQFREPILFMIFTWGLCVERHYFDDIFFSEQWIDTILLLFFLKGKLNNNNSFDENFFRALWCEMLSSWWQVKINNTFDDIFLRTNWRDTILLRALWRETTLMLIFSWGHNEERQYIWWYISSEPNKWDYTLRIFTWVHNEVKQCFWLYFLGSTVSILLMLFSCGHSEIKNFFDYIFLSSKLRAIIFCGNFHDFSHNSDNILSTFCGGGHSVERISSILLI